MLRCMLVLLLVSAIRGSPDDGHGGFFENLRQLSSIHLEFLPNRNNVSAQCQMESDAVKSAVQEAHIWAIKMIDANAKIPSGLLSGNVQHFGDFDLCLSVEEKSQLSNVRGRYCLVELDIKLKDDKWKDIDDRMHGYRSMTSNLTDPGQRLPKIESWRWGVCVPSACQAEDVSSHMNNLLNSRLRDFASVDLRVDSNLCYTYEKPAMSFGHYFTILVFSVLGVFITLGTFLDTPSGKIDFIHATLSCFSVRKNWAALTKTTNDGEDIGILHGTRALNALGLLLSHKQMAQFFNPFVNSYLIGQTVKGTWSMIGRSAILYTDSFIFISGLLAAHAMVKQLDRDKKINFKKNLLTRYLRFTPNLIFLILFCTYLTDFLGSGPQWGLVVSKYSELCKSNMWRNMLYIHNFFGFEDMCLTHTHQLGIDMQLFLVSPFLVYILWKKPKIGGIILLMIAIISTWLRFTVALDKQLSTVIYYGVSVKRLFDTAHYSYILPTHRASVYCIGLFLGYSHRRGSTNFNLSTTTAWFGWSVAAGLAAVAMFGPAHMAHQDYVYDPMDGAIYNAMAPIMWSLFLVWGVIACFNNRGGWLKSLLTWKYFTVFSRISYAFYLVQFPVFFYNVGSQRTSLFYKGFISILDFEEIAVVFAFSILLTLFVDMPFQNLRKIILSENSRGESVQGLSKTETNITRSLNHG